MNASQFSVVLNQLRALTRAQMLRLQAAVDSTLAEQQSMEAIEAPFPLMCWHCGSAAVLRNGTRNGLQRVRCKDCLRSSNAASNSPLSHLRHKEKFTRYARCMKDGMSLRATAAAVDISLDTAFRWRHRFLAAPQAHQPTQVAGLLEVDETYFRESQKGSRHMTRPSRNRGGKAVGRGRHNKDWVPVLVGRVRGQPYTTDQVLKAVNGAEVTAALVGVVKPAETILCTDGHSAFLHLQRTLGVQTKSFTASYATPGLDKVWHVQSANNYHERLKSWIQRGLRGVASKYLPNYLAWMRMSSWNKVGIEAEDFIASALGRQVINL